MWLNAFAVMFGLYLTLPIFTAVVLIRALAPNPDAGPCISKHCLLIKRDGHPVLQFRALSGTGRVEA